MTYEENDSPLQIHPDMKFEFVGRAEYCELALSNRKLIRCDQRDRGLRGLLDVDINKCYVIPEKELFGTEFANAISC
jgi:hypothetical protein